MHWAHVEKLSIKCKQIKPPDRPAKFIPVIVTALLKCFPGSQNISLLTMGVAWRVWEQQCDVIPK